MAANFKDLTSPQDTKMYQLIILYVTDSSVDKIQLLKMLANLYACYSSSAFLKLFSSADHFHYSECSTDHPTLGIIKLIRPALNSVRNMFLQQKIPLLLLRVE